MNNYIKQIHLNQTLRNTYEILFFRNPVMSNGISIGQPVLFLSFLVCPMVLSAQGVDIRGVIADSSTSEKLPFANVVLLGTNKGAASNINGFYLMLTQIAIGSPLMGNREDIFSLLPFHEDEYVLTTVKEIPIGGLDKPD